MFFTRRYEEDAEKVLHKFFIHNKLVNQNIKKNNFREQEKELIIQALRDAYKRQMVKNLKNLKQLKKLCALAASYVSHDFKIQLSASTSMDATTYLLKKLGDFPDDLVENIESNPLLFARQLSTQAVKIYWKTLRG